MAPNPTYEDAPFDDDDLINDYVDDEMPDPDYDEAYLEELMNGQDNDKDNQKNANRLPVSSTSDVDPVASTPNSNIPLVTQPLGTNNRNSNLQRDDDGDFNMEDVNNNETNLDGIPSEVRVDDGAATMDAAAETNFSTLRKDKENKLYSFERYVHPQRQYVFVEFWSNDTLTVLQQT